MSINYDHKAIQMRRGTSSEWREYGDKCVPLEAEICVELMQYPDGTISKNVGVKVGNGIDSYEQLPYVILNEETDPVFTSHPAYQITQDMIDMWSQASVEPGQEYGQVTRWDGSEWVPSSIILLKDVEGIEVHRDVVPDRTARYDIGKETKTFLNGWFENLHTDALTTEGDLTIGGNLEVEGDLAVEGDGHFTGNLEVDGDTTLHGNLEVDGETTLHGDLEVDGNTTLNGNLQVEGTTDLNGDLNVDGNGSFTGDLKVEGEGNFTGDLNVEGNGNFTGDLNVEGNGNFTQDINVGGNGNVTGNLGVEGNLEVDGNATIDGSLQINGGIQINLPDGSNLDLETELNDKVSKTDPDPQAIASTLESLAGFIGDGSELTDITTDQLADVNSENATKDQFLIHNGVQWVAEDFHIDTELTFQGGISVPNDTAPAAANGDLYINNEDGVAGASWTGIAGRTINTAVAVGWSAKNNRWYMLGDIGSAAVTDVRAGTGIDVEKSTPSKPVVSIDRTTTDAWYEPKFSKNTAFNKNFGTTAGTVAEGNHNHDASYSNINHNHDAAYSNINHNHNGVYEPVFTKNTAFNKNFGATAGTVSEGNHTHSQYLTSFTETDPTVPAHVKGITQAQINKWDSPAPGVDLTGYATETWVSNGFEPKFGKNSAFNKNFGATAGTVSEGNHTHSQYLTSFTETDPTVPAHVKSITTTNISNWNSAYGWGNHASAGYLKAYTETDPTVPAHVKGITQADIDKWNNPPSGGGGLPDGDWHCTGSIYAKGNITAYHTSDERKKDDIAPMPLNLIDGINPVTFKWKESGKSSGGVIAQQLQACGLEDWVNEGPDGTLGVDYMALIGVLLAEVQDLKLRVKELES